MNARLAGWKGAMYPWESCPMHGEEVTPGASAPTKGHATLDVALAFARASSMRPATLTTSDGPRGP